MRNESRVTGGCTNRVYLTATLRVFSGGRYIEVFRVEAAGWSKTDQKNKSIDRNFTRKLKEDEEEEDVAESGRLFVRNLPYTCTEEEIKDLFSKYGMRDKPIQLNDTNARTCKKFIFVVFLLTGPLSETLFPIDSLTKKPKGFAFISYMIPENAVTALAQLDGHVFQVW